jgi:hypothetical protein
MGGVVRVTPVVRVLAVIRVLVVLVVLVVVRFVLHGEPPNAE